jgi:uncharacterized protein
MLALISSALVMGLSASTYCLASCVPVLVPYAGTVGKPSLLSGFSLALLFSLGRLIAYGCLLAAFIALKEFVGVSNIVVSSARLVSGMLLILSALITFGALSRLKMLEHILCSYVAGGRSPLYLGIMTGIKPCGPLLAAIAFVLTLPSIGRMSVFMLAFWLASSVVLVSIGGFGGGVMSLVSKRIGAERMRRIAAIAMAFIGLVLILQAVGSFVSGAAP